MVKEEPIALAVAVAAVLVATAEMVQEAVKAELAVAAITAATVEAPIARAVAAELDCFATEAARLTIITAAAVAEL